MRLLLLAFRLPWWSYILIAFAIVLADDRLGLTRAAPADAPAAPAIAAAAPPAPEGAAPPAPDATPRSGPFQPGAERALGPDLTLAPGVMSDMVLRAQIDMGHATEVVRSDADGRAIRSVLLPLAAPGADAAPTEIRAYLEVPHARFADFSRWAAQRSDGAGRLGPLVRFEGLMTEGGRDSEVISASLADSRMRLAAGALRFRPYIDAPATVLAQARAEAQPPAAALPPAAKRVVDLFTLPEIPPLTPLQNVAAAIAAYGLMHLLLGAFLLKRRRRRADESGPDIYAPVDPLVPLRPAGRIDAPTGGDTPIDRIRARAAAQQQRRARLFNRG